MQQGASLAAEFALVNRMVLVALERQLATRIASDFDAAANAAVAADGLDGCGVRHQIVLCDNHANGL